MKLQKAVNIIKKSSTIILFQEDDRKLLSDGYAAYDVSIFPTIETEEQLAAVLGISKIKDHTFTIKEIPEIFEDESKTQHARLFFTKMIIDGDEFVLFDCGEIYAVRAEYLKPFEDDDLFKFIHTGDSCMILGGGFITTGYIFPITFGKKNMEEISEIARRGIWNRYETKQNMGVG